VSGRSARGALLLAGVLAAAGCAELQLPLPAGEPQFEIAGRIAVRYRDEASAGNFAWRHGVSGDEVLITTPLGQGIARIVRNAAGVTLLTPDGEAHRAADPESLSERVLGFRLPLDGLADWVLGRRGPGDAEEQRDAQGRLAQLRQSGWQIDYQEWRAEDGRPARLKLTYPGVELRLAIGEWK
jgi:outer membrane lipoprotein LolB